MARRHSCAAIGASLLVASWTIVPSGAFNAIKARSSTAGSRPLKAIAIPALDNVPTAAAAAAAAAATATAAPPVQIEEGQRTMPPSATPDRDAWVRNLDYAAFASDVAALGKRLQAETGDADVEHLSRILEWRDRAAWLGLLTMWAPVNPLTVLALSTWTYASWTMVAHHTCHGGYNRVDAGKYNSRGFALGTLVRRVSDWCDWMLPEAWNVEHNRLHHYHLSEDMDPDLVQRNLDFLRNADLPLPLKYVVALALMPVWKWFYYAPNTYKELQLSKAKADGTEPPPHMNPREPYTLRTMLFPATDSERAANDLVHPSTFALRVLAPFLLSRFVLLPSLLLAVPYVGPALYGHAVANLVLAELLTNVHSFVTIVTNHAGSDLYTFDDQVKPKSGSFYVRQVVSSANYDYGTDEIDFYHGWLNYQVEHHVWPDLSMLQYQKGAPLLREICEKHGVPYVQESVWTRLLKTLDIMVGKSTMMTFPTELEPIKDKAGSGGVTWKSTNGAIDDE